MNKSCLLDSNIIIRLFDGKKNEQFENSRKLLKLIESGEKKGWISILVIYEILWVLESYYEKTRIESIDLVLRILSIKNIMVLEMAKIELIKILEKTKELGIDYTDVYLLHKSKEKSLVLESYDKKMMKNEKL